MNDVAASFYLNDGVLIGDLNAVAEILGKFASPQARKYGLQLNEDKCTGWWPMEPASSMTDPGGIKRDKWDYGPGTLVLKAPVGSIEYRRSYFLARVGEIGETMRKIAELDDSQIAMYLLRQCRSLCLFNYLLRTTSSLAAREATVKLDEHFRQTFNRIGGTSVSKDLWDELQFPRKTKKTTLGLGLT